MKKIMNVTRKKAIVGAAAIFGACTLLCGGITQLALAAETGKVEQIPTDYSAVSVPISQDDLKGYVKANYKVTCEYEEGKPLPNNALSGDEAAEITAQNVWRFFGTSLEGKTIQIGYDPETNKLGATIDFDKDRIATEKGNHTSISYSLDMDAATGTLYYIEQFRTFPGYPASLIGKQVPDIPEDPALEKDYKRYQDLARADIEKHHLFSGKIRSIEYSGQGSSNNDPLITMRAYSNIGEELHLTYSRKDQAFIEYYSPDQHLKDMKEIAKIPPWDPELAALVAKNQAKLERDSCPYHTVLEDEKGLLYVDHVNEKGETERLIIGRNLKTYTGQ